ncbi:hypothetical protein [Algihabitans albus]|uniref:hypothetical protein n=1 Tax=Algihabitans albus TaxID=2164067 RepID=UPI0013C36C9E|nr:hypothetical protein [Algihabitans albus]
MSDDGAEIAGIIESELEQPVSAAVVAAAEEIRRRHGEAVQACLFYGSCLRDGRDEGRVLDFYALADSYRAFHDSRVMAFLNRLVPPNVYYLEMPFQGRTVRAKYAVISMAALARDSSPAALVPTIWARMAQPCALPYARNGEVRARVRDALVQAVRTTVSQTLPLLPPRFSASELWTRAFRESYRTEFRAERVGRSEVLHGAAVERYARLSAGALGAEARQVSQAAASDAAARAGEGPSFDHAADPGRRRTAERRWYWRRQAGRCLHVLRLIKNAHTFTDGLDYVLWKIETHSGIRTEPTAWQRRHPLLAAPGLAWRLYRKGAFR